ncbi:MAG: DNA repair protein RecN [Halieaceae bacterium]|nr:DNA repair protein RecN [Halieaceae bacterium]
MLSHLSISNYTIVSSLEMEFEAGMTVITGETGAGKSIMLDALSLCLGDRADPKAVRQNCDRAEINASFDISAIPAARQYLESRDLITGEECILRRVITAEGRSRAYINGSASTLQDCAELGAMLIDVHNQHAHQSLLRKEVQRQLLDAFANLHNSTRQLEQIASDWLRTRREREMLLGASDDHGARIQLLSYQISELDELALAPDELAALEKEQKTLANAEEILQSAHRALELCEAQEAGTRQALQLLQSDAHVAQTAANARDLLDSAAIQLNEARDEIQRYIDTVKIDPQRLESVQRRLELVYDIARKHKVKPEQLTTLHTSLQSEIQGLADSSERLDEFEQQMADLASRYQQAASKLSKQRRSAAKKLVKKVSVQLATLAMEQCTFEIALHPRASDDPHPHGQEDIEFLISTNPGASPQSLGKIASGGELSRISLAIGVVTASTGAVSSMVFDEVDVGIGGAVAEVVGKLLRTLADQAQVLCVTHLPQVAAQGHHHLQVTKTSADSSVEATLSRLDQQNKVREIARMLGGIKVTEQSLAHAREMVESSAT